MTSLKDEDVLLKLNNSEDSLVERKSINDLKDVLKTVVAFANSVPLEFTGVLFVGVRDNGEPEGVSDFDKIQKNIDDRISLAYPRIDFESRILEKGGKKLLAVLIPGSVNRPHFAGQAFVRKGNKSVVASEDQFNQLIATRNGVVREILKWKGKRITLMLPQNVMIVNRARSVHHTFNFVCTVRDCNPFYVTVQSIADGNLFASFPIRVVEINFDHRRNQMELKVREGGIEAGGMWGE